jgi:hypothetical protein
MRKAYHYVFQSAVRCQEYWAEEKTPYQEYKATLFMVALGVWWGLIFVCWIRPLREVVFSQKFIAAVVVAGGVALAHKVIMGGVHLQEAYQQQFVSWPRKKVRLFDSLVFAFVVFTLSAFAWSGFASKRLFEPSWRAPNQSPEPTSGLAPGRGSP